MKQYNEAPAYAKKGDTVKVDYKGYLEGGKVFDTSIEAEAKKAGLEPRPTYEPLQFELGAGQMIVGFEKGVLGMSVGQKKTLKLQPEEAYGVPREELVTNVSVKTLEEAGINVSVGVRVGTAQGAVGRITAISGGNATLDFNHDLAGKTLFFDVTLVGIN